MTQHLAAQVGRFGIRANCIAPETILTERNQERIPEAQKRTLADQHPIRRLGTPEDVARSALFLASDASAWITGVVLDVAGGAAMGIEFVESNPCTFWLHQNAHNWHLNIPNAWYLASYGVECRIHQ
jgi:enoyl-[acyl-carrier-protein] reductase (NADH)